ISRRSQRSIDNATPDMNRSASQRKVRPLAGKSDRETLFACLEEMQGPAPTSFIVLNQYLQRSFEVADTMLVGSTSRCGDCHVIARGGLISAGIYCANRISQTGRRRQVVCVRESCAACA